MMAITANGEAIGIATLPNRKGGTLLIDKMVINTIDLTDPSDWHIRTRALEFEVRALRHDKTYSRCTFRNWDHGFALPSSGIVILFGVEIGFRGEVDTPWAEAV